MGGQRRAPALLGGKKEKQQQQTRGGGGGGGGGRGEEEAMATGEITTLPATPEDGGSSFLPANFRDPKRLYCKNGGLFLRIGADGRVDGTREKTNPHSKCCQTRGSLAAHISLRK